MMLVVTDTGPLLHLHQIGAVVLLTHLGEIHVTPTVLSELRRHAPSFFTHGMPAWLIQTQPSSTALLQASRWVNAQMLDAGEAEALAFAHEAKAGIFITDDTAARTLGESLGLQVRGTLGVVLYNAASGHLDQPAALQILTDLEQRSTLWMSAKVKAAVRTGISQIFGKP
jgi:predicted nucleic acid-binding protein